MTKNPTPESPVGYPAGLPILEPYAAYSVGFLQDISCRIHVGLCRGCEQRACFWCVCADIVDGVRAHEHAEIPGLLRANVGKCPFGDV
jgi:hypothetical protein